MNDLSSALGLEAGRRMVKQARIVRMARFLVKTAGEKSGSVKLAENLLKREMMPTGPPKLTREQSWDRYGAKGPPRPQVTLPEAQGSPPWIPGTFGKRYWDPANIPVQMKVPKDRSLPPPPPPPRPMIRPGDQIVVNEPGALGKLGTDGLYPAIFRMARFLVKTAAPRINPEGLGGVAKRIGSGLKGMIPHNMSEGFSHPPAITRPVARYPSGEMPFVPTSMIHGGGGGYGSPPVATGGSSGGGRRGPEGPPIDPLMFLLKALGVTGAGAGAVGLSGYAAAHRSQNIPATAPTGSSYLDRLLKTDLKRYGQPAGVGHKAKGSLTPGESKEWLEDEDKLNKERPEPKETVDVRGGS